MVDLRPPSRGQPSTCYRQSVGAAVNKRVGDVGWTGRELVAFRLHLPSQIDYHNAGAGNLKRGNILVWEQTLTDRLRGVPLVLDARMQTQSILYSALTLFGATCVAVALMFAIVILWSREGGVVRKARFKKVRDRRG